MNCSHRQFVYLLKNLLVFHVMYKCGQPLFGPGSSPSDANNLLLLLCKLVMQIITYCPRQEGNKWKLQKLYKLLHFPLMLFFFCPIVAFQHFLLAICSAGHWLTKRNVNYIHRHQGEKISSHRIYRASWYLKSQTLIRWIETWNHSRSCGQQCQLKLLCMSKA
jgi:hypothetical protein